MLYIIRHGKTDWNQEYRLQGRSDIPLNDEGRQMARDAAVEYKDINFDVCYCSPLIRARETAEILLEGRNVPIISDERLIEMGFGVFEGVSNIYDMPDAPMRVFFFNPELYVEPVENGESLDAVYERTGDFLKNVAYPLVEQGKDVLIVGHGAMNSAIVSQVKNKDRKDFWSDGIPNCKLMKLI